MVVAPVGDELVLVTVRWEYLDRDGFAAPGARYRYLLRASDNGPRITVVMRET